MHVQIISNFTNKTLAAHYAVRRFNTACKKYFSLLSYITGERNALLLVILRRLAKNITTTCHTEQVCIANLSKYLKCKYATATPCRTKSKKIKEYRL